MDDLEMTPFELAVARRLQAHSVIEVRPANALAIARDAMTARRRPGFLAAWQSLRPSAKAVIAVALLATLLVASVIVGSRLLFPTKTVVLPTSEPVPSIAIVAAPAGEDLRSRWLANVGAVAGLGNGSGPVTLTIDPTGSVLSLANLAPGAAFTSRTSVAGDVLRLELLSASGGCASGATGEYGETQSADRSRLTLVAVSDQCQTRAAAIARAWDRTLLGPTSVGAGVVDSFEPNFKVTLPDHPYEARTLDDFIEIGDPASGFSLMVFKNPQGFVDACSPDQVRYPYTPGAAAFVDYYRQNDAFTVVEASPLKVDGHDAIHLVTKVKVEGARCPGADLYALTPKACNCHFFGGDDSIYLVDVGADTFFFQLSPTVDAATELPIINTIRIPYSPGQQSP